MHFQDIEPERTVFHPVLHHRREELAQARQYVGGALEYDGVTVEFTARILSLQLTCRERDIGYDHPGPFFSRVFLFHDVPAEYEDDDIKTVMEPGRVYFLPAGRTFRTLYHAGSRQLGLHLHLTDFTGQSIFTAADSFRELTDDGSLASRLAAAAALPPVRRLSPFMAIVAAALEPKLSELARRSREMSVFAPLFALLNRRPPVRLGIDELARRLNLTADTLSHRFRRRMGVPLKSYLDGLLMQRAAQELLHSSLSVGEIAAELGFDNEKYFHRFFKKHCGLTPGEYRRRHPSGS